jgi:hypothetical protein
MNVISFDVAYSLYPRATFEERRTLSMSVSNEGEAEALGKYAVRGWKILCDILPHEENKPLASFHQDVTRWVDDEMSWKIPLDMTGLIMRPPPSENSCAFNWDPVKHNSWKLIRARTHKLLMTYHVAKSTLFRYNYLIADSQFLYTLVGFFRRQGSLERLKRTLLSVEEQRASVTWCVSWSLVLIVVNLGRLGGTQTWKDSVKHILRSSVSREERRGKGNWNLREGSVRDATDQ